MNIAGHIIDLTNLRSTGMADIRGWSSAASPIALSVGTTVSRELGRVITHQLGWDATSGEDVLQLRSARCRCHVTVVQYLYPPRVVVHYYHVVLSLRQTGSLILSAMALWVEELSSVAPSVASVCGLDNGRKHPVCA